MFTDAFLHQIHTGTANLKFLVNRVREIIEQKVEGTIDRIKNMMLFDYELAFSKSWVSTKKIVKLLIYHVEDVNC